MAVGKAEIPYSKIHIISVDRITRNGTDYTVNIPGVISTAREFLVFGCSLGGNGHDGSLILDIIRVGYNTANVAIDHFSSSIISSATVDNGDLVLHASSTYLRVCVIQV